MEGRNEFVNHLVRDLSPETVEGKLYEKILQGLDNPFADYLRQLHVAPTTSGKWTESIKKRYQVTRKPHIHPGEDSSIRQIIEQDEVAVQLLLKGLNNLEGIIDNPGSKDIETVREGRGVSAEYKEATCRKVMVALIHRCVIGYFGHDKKDDAKQDDMHLTCEERFFHVYNTLRQAKMACRDVLFEDSKIDILVHEPKTILRNKMSQLRTNNARKKAAEENKEKAEQYDKQKTSRSPEEEELAQAHEVAEEEEYDDSHDVAPMNGVGQSFSLARNLAARNVQNLVSRQSKKAGQNSKPQNSQTVIPAKPQKGKRKREEYDDQQRRGLPELPFAFPYTHPYEHTLTYHDTPYVNRSLIGGTVHPEPVTSTAGHDLNTFFTSPNQIVDAQLYGGNLDEHSNQPVKKVRLIADHPGYAMDQFAQDMNRSYGSDPSRPVPAASRQHYWSDGGAQRLSETGLVGANPHLIDSNSHAPNRFPVNTDDWEEQT